MAKYVAEGAGRPPGHLHPRRGGRGARPRAGAPRRRHEDDLGPTGWASSRRPWPRWASPTSSGSAATGASATRAWPTTTRACAIARDVLREGIFWTTDLLEAADELVPLIRDRRPQVLITYDQFGGYGHPDHVQAHRVAMYGYAARRRPVLPARPRRGLDGAAGALDDDEHDPDGEPASKRCARRATPRRSRAWSPERGGCCRWSPTTRHRRRHRRHGVRGRRRWTPCAPTPPRSPRTARSSPGPRCSATSMWSHEHYRFVAGVPFPDSDGWADDLFAGLD